MQIFYSDHFPLPLPEGHRFPMSKYTLLRQRVENSGLAGLTEAPAATDAQIRRAHTIDYWRRVEGGRLTSSEIRRIGFPWSSQMVERSRRSAGATVAACRSAVRDGVSLSLAGGTHHAFRDRGEGFCVLNDSVIAARTLQAEGVSQRILIVDCDVHQGNGTASILSEDSTIFTFSIHGARNFPFHKETSDLDIPLPNGTGDSEYLRMLRDGLQKSFQISRPHFVLYLSGADPYKGDRLGRLSLTKEGLAARDQMVLTACRRRRLPVAVTMGGGYAPNIEDIVDIHFQTVRKALGNGELRVSSCK